MLELSVIAPIYNEEENLERLTTRISEAVEKKFKNYEIIYVNDGSTDSSKTILDKLAFMNSKLKVYHFTKNNGQTAALAAGFKKCQGSLIVTMDADLQTDPEDIYRLLPYIEEYDMVNGKRATREDGFIKKLSSFIGNSIRNKLTGDSIQDTGCPLKLFKKEVVKDYKLFEGMHRFLPTLAKMNGYKVVEVPVRHFDRKFGVSKYGVWNRMLKGLKDAFAVRWMIKRNLNYVFDK